MNGKKACAYPAALFAAAFVALSTSSVLAGKATASDAGQIRAKGTGSLSCRGQGDVVYTLHGQGKLVVRNRLSVKIASTGEGRPRPEGPIAVYVKYKGSVKVTGAKINCQFEGGQVSFAGRGRGTVYLKGTGKYWTDRKGPFPWKASGQTLTLGAEAEPEEGKDDADENGDETVYYDESKATVEELTDCDAYSLWAQKHPLAAKYLAEHADLTAFLNKHPAAAQKLFEHKKFPAWARAHSNAANFITAAKDYHAWCKAHPLLAGYLHNPVAWHRWLKDHTKVAKALKAKKYKDWKGFAEAHPAAAAALRKHDLAVKKHLDANHNGKVDAKERHNAWKRRADRNKDGKVDANERKAAGEKRRRRLRHTDRNRDGRGQPEERTRNLRERHRRNR